MTRATLFLLLLAGCGAAEPEAKPPVPVALVALAPATRGDVAEHLTVYGAAATGASGERTLSAPVEATLIAIRARVGQHVRAGEVVAELRPSPAAALDRTRAATDAATAAAAYGRAQRLRTDGLVSDAEVETARAAARTAAATQASLAARAAAVVLRAPVAGTVSSLAASPGEQLAAGAAVAKIAARLGVRAHFGVDPAVARLLAPGAAIVVAPAAGNSAGFTTRITDIDQIADPATRLATVYADVPPATNIASGEALRGVIVARRRSGAVTVPDAALLDEGGQAFAFVVTNGIAHRRDVRTGASEAGRTIIDAGIAAGEAVVVAGGTALDDGMKVRTGPIPAAPAEKP